MQNLRKIDEVAFIRFASVYRRFEDITEFSEEVEKLIITVADTRLVENTLGLVGEAGEVAEKIKKFIRDEDLSKEEIVKELGDVLFYTTALANHIGSDLQTVMNKNIEKLHDRLERNMIKGSGDNR